MSRKRLNIFIWAGVCVLAVVFGIWFFFRQPTSSDAYPFLVPYVDQMMAELKPEEVRKLVLVPEDQLYRLHMGYGMAIRNKWLWGDREPRLVQYMNSIGYRHPDNMSSLLIRLVWLRANEQLTLEEREKAAQARQEERARDRERRVISDECMEKSRQATDAFRQCLREFGRPGVELERPDTFYFIIVSKTGDVQHIEHYNRSSKKLRSCVDKIVKGFRFTPFRHSDTMRAYYTEFPACRVSGLGGL